MLFCKACGKVIDEDSKYCRFCGAVQSGKDEEQKVKFVMPKIPEGVKGASAFVAKSVFSSVIDDNVEAVKKVAVKKAVKY